MPLGQRRSVTRTWKECYKDREGVLLGQRSANRTEECY